MQGLWLVLAGLPFRRPPYTRIADAAAPPKECGLSRRQRTQAAAAVLPVPCLWGETPRGTCAGVFPWGVGAGRQGKVLGRVSPWYVYG